VAEAVRILVAGLPAEIVREIGLRIRGATVSEFENTQQMGRAAGQGESLRVVGEAAEGAGEQLGCAGAR